MTSLLARNKNLKLKHSICGNILNYSNSLKAFNLE